MQILSMPRQSGRTTKAIEWVKKDPHRILVVHSEQEKDRILKEYGKRPGRENGLTFQQVETIETIRRHYYGPTLRTKQLLIDNIELILPRLLDNPDAHVEGFTCEHPVEDFLEPEDFYAKRHKEVKRMARSNGEWRPVYFQWQEP